MLKYAQYSLKCIIFYQNLGDILRHSYFDLFPFMEFVFDAGGLKIAISTLLYNIFMKIGFLYPIEKNSLIMIKLHLFLFRRIAFDLLFPLMTAQKSLGDNRVGFIAKVCAAFQQNPSKMAAIWKIVLTMWPAEVIFLFVIDFWGSEKNRRESISLKSQTANFL